MDLNNKQRAYLTSLASREPAVVQIGKASLTPEIVSSADEALAKRELIKITILKNCMDDPRAIAEMIAGRTKSTVVQVIGKKIVLYKESKEHKKIQLPLE